MLSSLTLLRLACSHDRHLWKLLVPNHLDHVHRGLWDSALHWTWLWLELSRSSKMLAWLFLCHHTLYHIPFLLIFLYMSTIYFIRLKDMLLITVHQFAMPCKIWLILGWSTCLDQVWLSIPCLHILRIQFPHLLVFSRALWMLMIFWDHLTFWDFLVWGFLSIDMGVSLRKASIRSAPWFGYGSP